MQIDTSPINEIGTHGSEAFQHPSSGVRNIHLSTKQRLDGLFALLGTMVVSEESEKLLIDTIGKLMKDPHLVPLVRKSLETDLHLFDALSDDTISLLQHFQIYAQYLALIGEKNGKVPKRLLQTRNDFLQKLWESYNETKKRMDLSPAQ